MSWYRQYRAVHAGERWCWILKLKPIHGLKNPGGFDFSRWAKRENIIASGYVYSNKGKLISKNRFSIDRYRESMQQSIKKAIHSKQLSGVIDALTTGSKNLLTPSAWLIFQRTGTSHLMAISGLHVGLVVTIAYFIFNYGFRCFPFLLLVLPAQRWSAIFSTFIAWIYAFLVGFSLPTQRAVIMVTVLMLSSLFLKKTSIFMRLLMAFFIVLAFQPLAIYSVSFWLSFMAVFWLAYAVFSRHRSLTMKFSLGFGLLPITLYVFHQVSISAFFANLIAIPWVTFLIVPLCLLASVLFLFSNAGACWVWGLAAKCFYPLWFVLKYLSQLPVWLHPVNNFAVMICALLGVLFLTAPRGFPSRVLGVVLLLPLFLFFPARPKPNEVWLTVLDVGQGLASVIQTANHILVYDTGPRFPTGFDAGRSVLIPFLKTRGVHKINTLMVSHGDNDHIGGSFWLEKHMPIDTIYSSIPKTRWHRSYVRCVAGQHWEWDGVRFDLLWPKQSAPYLVNDSSCVLRIRVGDQAVLLTGDIEKSAESVLLEQKAELKADVLVAPHHGSRSSSSAAFVKAVHPKVVIMPVGFRNRYHFPAKAVLQRYRSVGAQILSTSERGAVTMKLGIAGRIRDNGRLIS